MEEKILIQAFSPFSFTDKETNKLMEGVTVFYLANSSREVGINNGKMGYFPVKETLDISYLDKLKNGVGFYVQKIGLKSVKGKQGYQNVVSTLDLKFIERFEIK